MKQSGIIFAFVDIKEINLEVIVINNDDCNNNDDSGIGGCKDNPKTKRTENRYVKSVRIRRFSGLKLPTFGLNMEILGKSLYSVPVRENVDQKNSEYEHFLLSDY